MILDSVRQLSPAETRFLRGSLWRARRRLRCQIVRCLLAIGVICSLLCIATLLVSRDPVPVIVGFWISVAVLLLVWTGWELLRDGKRRIRALDGALQRNSAHVTRITASRVVELEEAEDEGACFGFEQPDGVVVFVVGQDFYPTRKFPSTDFSLVWIYDLSNAPVELLVENHGTKVEPVRIISCSDQHRFRRPSHLDSVDATIDNIEVSLAAQQAHAAGDRRSGARG
jgi:hypothetical protein